MKKGNEAPSRELPLVLYPQQTYPTILYGSTLNMCLTGRGGREVERTRKRYPA